MLVADLTLITSKRESGPLVARESIQCGTPVVSVDVGDVSEYLPEFCISSQYDPIQLADTCEAALKHDWSDGFELPDSFTAEVVAQKWDSLLESLVG
jgi:glycosyltransferase involved in cell wall biosynthesis